MRSGMLGNAWLIVLVAPLTLAACASHSTEPTASQAMATANQSKSTADQALSTAQQALQTAQKAEGDAQAASQKSDQMYNRSLRK